MATYHINIRTKHDGDYDGVVVTTEGSKLRKLYNTGNPVADWESYIEDAIEMIEIHREEGEEIIILYGSSLTDFVMDNDHHKFVMVQGVEMLVKID